MKKLTMIVMLIFVLALPAWGLMVIHGPVRGGGGDPCGCSGTYTFCYTGDHASGTTYACYDSGASNEAASANTADSVSTDYMEYDATNEYLEWTESGLVDDAGQTIFFSVYFIDRDSDSTVGTCNLMESYYDASNYIKVVYQSGYFRFYYYDGSISDVYKALTPSFTTWYRIGVTWDVANDKYSISVVTLGSSPSWNEQTGEGLSAMTADPLSVVLGEDAGGNGVDERIRNKDAIIVGGYQSADPLE